MRPEKRTVRPAMLALLMGVAACTPPTTHEAPSAETASAPVLRSVHSEPELWYMSLIHTEEDMTERYDLCSKAAQIERRPISADCGDTLLALGSVGLSKLQYEDQHPEMTRRVREKLKRSRE
jgi:hypothetical protein